MTNKEAIRRLTEEGLIKLIYCLTEGEIDWCRMSKCPTAALDGFYAAECDWCVHKWLNADAEEEKGLKSVLGIEACEPQFTTTWEQKTPDGGWRCAACWHEFGDVNPVTADYQFCPYCGCVIEENG